MTFQRMTPQPQAIPTVMQQEQQPVELKAKRVTVKSHTRRSRKGKVYKVGQSTRNISEVGGLPEGSTPNRRHAGYIRSLNNMITNFTKRAKKGERGMQTMLRETKQQLKVALRQKARQPFIDLSRAIAPKTAQMRHSRYGKSAPEFQQYMNKLERAEIAKRFKSLRKQRVNRSFSKRTLLNEATQMARHKLLSR
jgi:hypothetical protein